MTTDVHPVRPAAIWHEPQAVAESWGPSVVTMGVFDGVHRGHARLIGSAVELGRRRGLPVVLVTFNPHPASVVGDPRDTSMLTTLQRRAALAAALGCAAILVLPFDEAMARTPAGEFVETVLVDALAARGVVVGAGFRFGHRGMGDIALLNKLGGHRDFDVHEVELRPGCSSTRVRMLLGEGDVNGAARVLGRPHRVSVCGSRECRCSPEKLPPPGDYVVAVNGMRAAIATIGNGGGVVVDGRAAGLTPATVDFIDRA